MNSDKTIRSGICGFCGFSCPVDLHLENGKIVSVEGNNTLPTSTGHLCVMGSALKQSVYSPERLLYPMKRIGKRGEGKFERITWDEALDTIADRMAKTKVLNGPEQTLLFVGHPKWFRPQLQEFASEYGSPNLGSESSTCAYAVMMAFQSVFGERGAFPRVDFRGCKSVVMWGNNPFYADPVNGSKMYLDALKRGIKVIAVDPRCTPTTEYADIHLRPVPGTDGALALGIAAEILSRGLQNQEYIDKYTYGFEEYREYVKEFTPERVEAITGVPKQMIIDAAVLIGENAPCPIHITASPLVHNINGVQNLRAIIMLMLLTGAYGVPGGVMAPGPGMATFIDSFEWTRNPRANPEKDLSHNEFPAWVRLCPHEAQVVRIANFLKGEGDYPIRNLIAFGMNHHMWPRPDRIEQGLQDVEFFADADIYMTETAKYADILLPIQSNIEREQISRLGLDTIFYQPPLIEPLGEAKTDLDILLGLSERLGLELGGDIPIHSYDEYLRRLIIPTGLTLEEIKAAPEGIKAKKTMPAMTTDKIVQVMTPSGKMEFVSQVLKECDKKWNEALPVYHDFRDELPMDEYPLILATGSRKPQLFHSRTYRLDWLTSLEKYPLVELHPDDAAKYGVEDGETVVLSTPIGSMDIEASVNTSCLPGVVNVYHGAGAKDINYLLDDNYIDPVSGFPGFKSYCCRLSRKEM